jgi:hypothetical protein
MNSIDDILSPDLKCSREMTGIVLNSYCIINVEMVQRNHDRPQLQNQGLNLIFSSCSLRLCAMKFTYPLSKYMIQGCSTLVLLVSSSPPTPTCGFIRFVLTANFATSIFLLTTLFSAEPSLQGKECKVVLFSLGSIRTSTFYVF